MTSFSKSTLSVVVALLVAFNAHASIFTISDERVRKKDISPTLGRGYSIMTDQYHSTCLMVEETTVPSYNYECKYSTFIFPLISVAFSFHSFQQSIGQIKTDNFEEYKSQRDIESSFSGSSAGSFFGILISPVGVGALTSQWSGSSSSSFKSKAHSHMVTTSMKIERYYSSVREEVSPLSADAAAILDDDDYVGFFKACGPNYVRGIRRVQEVMAMFNFKSSSVESASQFSRSMSYSITAITVVGGFHKSRASSEAAKHKNKLASSSMSIKIVGFGIGLGADGSETFVATKLEQYEQVMKYAFNAMTRGSESAHIGMVYGIEIVPWVHNTGFQAAAKIGEENIVIPMPRSLIPRAKLRVSPFTTWSDNTNDRDDYRCKDSTFLIDKYGYCCEINHLYDPQGLTYSVNDVDETTHVCRPFTQLDPSLIKENMSNNGEFISRLDAAMRYRLTSLAQLESCVSAVHSVPESFQYNYLAPQANIKHDNNIPTRISLMELKMAVDPQSNYDIVKHVAQEVDEWVEMFYTKCFAAIYGTNIGSSPDVDVSYFMAYPWYSHDECMHLTCMSSTMRWDREFGGCVPSLLSGATSQSYGTLSGTTSQDDIDDEFCARNEHDFINDSCKYTRQGLAELRDHTISCWSRIPNLASIDYILAHFCLPEVTMEEPTDRELCDIRKTQCGCAKDEVVEDSDTCFSDAVTCADLDV